MLRAAGAGCILCGAALGRWIALGQRRRQRRALFDLSHVLTDLAEEIRMAREAMPVLLERHAARCGPDAARLLRAAASAARRGEDLADAWQAAARALPLSEGDRQRTASLGAALRGDEERVCRALRAASEGLERSAAELERRREAEERRSGALLFSAAALLVILLY